MALQGTIKDFALPDIFQLIGIQRKTGILTLEGGDETVTLKFHAGQVVGADTEHKSLEDRLGEVLVRTGRITKEQLAESLRAQKSTLQRLGYILVSAGYISDEDLREALHIQAAQIIYRLFRWHEGDYHFDPVEDLEYDQRHFEPISAETILMEGARMIDEWPIIERRIKSSQMVFRKTASADALDLEAEPAMEQQDLEFDFGFDFDQGQEPARAEPHPEIKLSPDERRLMALVDGKRSVGEICDLLAVGEFDTYRMMADLLTRNLIEEVPRGREPQRRRAPSRLLGRLIAGAAYAALAATALATLATILDNPFTPWRVLERQPATEQLRQYLSVSRLEAIEAALEVFYLDAGSLPSDLTVLARSGYLSPGELIDPWGRPYLFLLSSGGYQLVGLDAAGEPSPELTVSRGFNPVQREMLTGDDVSPR